MKNSHPLLTVKNSNPTMFHLEARLRASKLKLLTPLYWNRLIYISDVIRDFLYIGNKKFFLKAKIKKFKSKKLNNTKYQNNAKYQKKMYLLQLKNTLQVNHKFFSKKIFVSLRRDKRYLRHYFQTAEGKTNTQPYLFLNRKLREVISNKYTLLQQLRFFAKR